MALRRERFAGSVVPAARGRAHFTQDDLGGIAVPRDTWWPSAIPRRWCASG
jgi:hypothetical protein